MTGRERLYAVLREIVVPLVAVSLGFAITAVVILVSGHSPLEVYGILVSTSLGSWAGLGNTLFNATPLIFSGLAVALCFRGGLFNIGVEGQLYVAAYAAAWVGYVFTGLPSVVHLALVLATSIVVGGVWGAVPGYIKARTGAHEVVNTIMMNFIATALVGYLITYVFRHPTQPQRTPAVAQSAILPGLAEFGAFFGVEPPRGVFLNAGFLLALVVAAATYVLLWKTSLGYRIRAVGENPVAALANGINVPRITVISMVIGGAIGGLTGLSNVLGYQHYFQEGFSPGFGFTGIAVALLGRTHPVGVIIAAIFFGALNEGALMVNIFTGIPQDLIRVLQAIIVFFAGCDLIVRQLLQRRRSREVRR